MITQLRPRLQRVALLRALQFSKSEIADLTGDSVGRVDKLVSTASQQIQEILSARLPSRQQLSPRAERLWDLEHESPRWLVDQIGRPPRPSRKGSGSVELRRAWRRAAIALDDYRRAVGAEIFASSGLSQPADRALEPAHAKALCAVDDHALLRGSGREREHER
ncbi:hypothetical protein [Solirubrobacter soli]|uniref:hypothetical protein n=1 Tax=Solirubrobacter soli TaxID=363832 RepID=UPI000481C820|nr:hypothetical protein [Solirubrobacter soli]